MGARIRLAALRTFQGRFPEARALIGEAYERGGCLDNHVRQAIATNTRLGSLPFAALAHCELAHLLGPTRDGRHAATQAREIAD